ncbi:PREDICTED: glutathione S-transferase 1 [Bactrocera latifrons]|uniref:Glutathione S-transferase 1 n=1 Tax=Bactrocera latifrons TaxID=174628 RepID=A0A0K8UDV1_BACLA|nr:PREDICTED: glutathione S-transferase 1 [Bactrocera latifrons]
MSKPKLYYSLFSPPARACMLTAELIGLDLELMLVNMAAKQHLTPEFLALNPQHQIPVFVEEDNEVFIDSHAIMAYMVSKYHKNDDMYPKDLKKRARVDHMLHFENGVLFQVIKDMVRRNIYGGEGEFNKTNLDLCDDAYSFLEAFLGKSNFFANSETLTIADVCINTTLVSLDMLIPVNKNRFPRLQAWMERMKVLLPSYEEVNIKGAKVLCERIRNCMRENKVKTETNIEYD